MISFNDQQPIDLKKILAPGGPIAKAYDGFEVRPQQQDMAVAVNQAREKNFHLAVEAGTGVGKSFAYLIPAVEHVRQKKGKVLISTYTISLQQQLINKDIPFLAECLGQTFTATLAKGRANYLCLRRLSYALRKQQALFDDSHQLTQINDWAKQTDDGSLSDLPTLPASAIWDAVSSEHGNCRGRKCPHFRQCFYFRARRKLETTDIIVANHALLFSDLVLKAQSAAVMPEYNFVIIDEAHNIEHVAERHFGINMTNFTFTYLLNRLYNPRTRRGLLAFAKTDDAIKLVTSCRKAAKEFFADIRAWHAENKDKNAARCPKNFVTDSVTEHVKNLRLALAKLAKHDEDEDEKFEFTRYIDRCKAIETDLRNFLNHSVETNVYWVEATSRTTRQKTSLQSAPVNVGPDVKRCLFDVFSSVVCTSATLSCDGGDEKAGFDFFASRIGLEKFKALKLGSPFDYRQQVTMYIEADLPDPNHEDFAPNAVETLKKYLLKTQGSAFILFTSYSMLTDFADRLEDWLRENDMPLLRQDAGIDRQVLLDRFRQDHSSVLCGTDSYWQGIDVPGPALSNVIIVRLPFAVPNHPLLKGRLEQIRLQGQNPFHQYQLPSAIIKFKQGFGRLIRNKTDSGIIVVLDSRIVRKGYGRQFIAAVPNCRVKIISQQNSSADY